MDLKQLKEKGGIVSAVPVPVEVEWTHQVDGQEVTDKFTVHVRRASFGAMERLFSGTDDQSKAASHLSGSILLNGGKEELSYEDAYQLDPSLAAALMKAVNEVNGKSAKN